jgi:hypothetical protein
VGRRGSIPLNSPRTPASRRQNLYSVAGHVINQTDLGAWYRPQVSDKARAKRRLPLMSLELITGRANCKAVRLRYGGEVF